ncbi:MAG TPA: EpsG family protein [Flavobacterium sp.]|nr:EpsG family protein [Flavobacterium sp.]
MNIIPIQYYATVYYNILLFIVVVVYFQSFASNLESSSNLKSKQTLGAMLLAFIIIYMGIRDIDIIFVDMYTYSVNFQAYADGAPFNADKDLLFEIFTMFSSKVMTVGTFFLLCTFLYVYPLYLATKKMFKEYWFYGFLMLVISFSFWAYGTNGIRNGIATSVFIYGISLQKKIPKIIWVILAVMIHKALILPALAFAMTYYYSDSKMYLRCWFLAIPLSLALGSFWEGFFLSFGFGEEERLAGYLSGSQDALDQIVEVKTGFRWDFLLYSATGVFAGWYYIVRKKFTDKFYNRLYSTYLIANGFWVLVIRANFSNRFAYLSWFILGLVIIYPLLKNKIADKQHQLIGRIVLIYFLFTFVLDVVLK